jgi:hypothetical protein
MQFRNTFDDVQGQVEADDAGKWDQIVPCRTVTMEHGRLLVPGTDFEGGLSLSPWAQGQLCSRLGLPAAYFKKCPPHLQDANFNHWNWHREVGNQLKAKDWDPDEAWMLRGKGTSVRGVLTPKYTKLDNAQLLSAILPFLTGKNFQVGLVQVNPESFHLRLIDPFVSRYVLPGDKLMVGIHIANSEVGLRAVTVDALVFREICTNGLIRRINQKSLLHQRHLHVSEPRFADMLGEAFQEAIAVAAGFIEQMAMATRTPITDPNKAIERLAGLWNLSKQTVELIKFALYGEKNQDSLYGLINAVTQVAQQFAIEQRFEMETLASLLIDDPKLRASITAKEA